MPAISHAMGRANSTYLNQKWLLPSPCAAAAALTCAHGEAVVLVDFSGTEKAAWNREERTAARIKETLEREKEHIMRYEKASEEERKKEMCK